MAKQNWFPTLYEALESEGLRDAWDMMYPAIGYGETYRWTWEDGSMFGHLISIYRNEQGMYERPVHYKR